MLTIEVNGKRLEAEKGETILQAARRGGIHVPTLCALPDMPAAGACRVCVVEVENAAGLLAACTHPVADGMKIQTHSPRVVQARRTLVELLLANHPDDCLYCGRSEDCELHQLARELGVNRRPFRAAKIDRPCDGTGFSLTRDPDKCILCGKCVRVCADVQTVAAIDFIGRGCQTQVGTALDQGLGASSCVNCGQCLAVCPTGALIERSHLAEVIAALRDPRKMVVVQHAPAVSVTLAEEMGLDPACDADGMLVAALRRMGFHRVFDTSFTADLTIMEEASELVQRIQTGGPLPLLTSCSPGWIKFVEQFYPDLLANVSTCKSPQQMLGALIKTFFAERAGVDPDRLVSVSIMPCTAKKFEAGRPEMARNFVRDVDFVLTTREAAQLLRTFGINVNRLDPEAADTPFGERSSAGKIFGASGGVMEAAVRTAHFLITGRELPVLDIQPLRGLEGAKELHVRIGDLEVGAAVVSGLGHARSLLEQVRAGRRDLHVIEVMTCPGGCINGGGQPRHRSPSAIAARMNKLYALDQQATLRTSHANESVARLYREFLGQPLGERSHQLLHTHYQPREVLL